MIGPPFAHLGHSSGLIAFAVPGVLLIAWLVWTGWRDHRPDRFTEYWTLSRRDGRWTLVAVEPDHAASRRRIRSPWSQTTAGRGPRGVAAPEHREHGAETPIG
jgi:hypothetical protein